MNCLLPVFRWVLHASATAGILVIVILLLKRLLGPKLNSRWHAWVWVLVLIRLLLPIAPEAPFSAFNLGGVFSHFLHTAALAQPVAGPINQITDTVTELNNSGGSPGLYNNQNNLNADHLPDSSGLPGGTSNHEFYLELGCLVWLAGASVFGLGATVKRRSLVAKLKTYSTCQDENILALVASSQKGLGLTWRISVLETDQKTPAVSGFIRPKLLLPAGIGARLTSEELGYVILHELAHLKRLDTVLNYLLGLMRIMHWFNPVLWIAFSSWREDREIACDAYVLDRIGAGRAKAYGQVIIKLLESYSPPCAYGTTGLLGGKSQIKRRLTMISRFSKNSYRWTVLSIGIILVLGTVLLTDAQAMDGKDTAVAPNLNPAYSAQGTIAQSGAFRQDVDEDIAASFGLALENMQKVDEPPLYEQQEDPYASTLLGVLAQVRTNQEFGDIHPSVYLQQDGQSGYVLEKKADGGNYLYTIVYNQGWAVAKTESRQGKKLLLKDNGSGDKVYSPLTAAQLDRYLTENRISPLAVQDVGKFTVILFKSKREDKSDREKALLPPGVDIMEETKLLTADQEGNIINKGGGGGGDNSDIVPASLGWSASGSELGYVGYSTVIFNDLDLLKDACTVQCCYQDNVTTTTPVDQHKAFIIPFPEQNAEEGGQKEWQLLNVIISDQEGKVLFDNNQWSNDYYAKY